MSSVSRSVSLTTCKGKIKVEGGCGNSPCYSIAQGGSLSEISLRQYVLGEYQYLAVPDALNGAGNGFTDYYLQPERGN